MKKEKRLVLKKEIKGYLLMLLLTVVNVVIITTQADTLQQAVAFFGYNVMMCLMILAFVEDTKKIKK